MRRGLFPGLVFAVGLGTRAADAQCQPWCSKWTCMQPPCFECDACSSGTKAVHRKANTSAGEYSYDMCVGTVETQDHENTFHVVRNTGGGTSTCCHEFPEAGGAKILAPRAGSTAFEIELQTRGNRASRNGARVYLADTCDGKYDNQAYAGLSLLGKTFSFTTDLSQTDCGCNAAMYLVSMKQNPKPGSCDGDYYCDANEVCGTRCAEIDLMEANLRAFKATAHTASDKAGRASGLGGGDKAFTEEQYGPGGSVVDTTQPFRVDVHFAKSGTALEKIEVTLTGSAGRSLNFSISEMAYLQQLSDAVLTGMTPTFSYWSGWDMGWLDSGPCRKDDQDACGDWVRFSDIQVTEGRSPPAFRPKTGLPGADTSTAHHSAVVGKHPPGMVAIAWADAPPPSPSPPHPLPRPPDASSPSPILSESEPGSEWTKELEEELEEPEERHRKHKEHPKAETRRGAVGLPIPQKLGEHIGEGVVITTAADDDADSLLTSDALTSWLTPAHYGLLVVLVTLLAVVCRFLQTDCTRGLRAPPKVSRVPTTEPMCWPDPASEPESACSSPQVAPPAVNVHALKTSRTGKRSNLHPSDAQDDADVCSRLQENQESTAEKSSSTTEDATLRRPSTMSPKELKKALEERGIDVSGFCEKGELVDALKRAIAQDERQRALDDDLENAKVRPML